jgi:hypothetical protein
MTRITYPAHLGPLSITWVRLILLPGLCQRVFRKVGEIFEWTNTGISKQRRSFVMILTLPALLLPYEVVDSTSSWYAVNAGIRMLPYQAVKQRHTYTAGFAALGAEATKSSLRSPKS